ncbi:MAG TPA: hypothetical protein VIW24_06420 [Aldersonia sp.]
MKTKDSLAIYLNDHYAGAAAGVALIERIARAHDGPVGAESNRLAAEITADRNVLRQLMRHLGIGVSRYKMIGGWLAEKVARLKSNGRIIRRSPLSSVIETEGMLTGVHAKAAAWRLLRAVAEHDTRLDPAEFDALVARAEDQARSLEQLRITMALDVFGRHGTAASAVGGSTRD